MSDDLIKRWDEYVESVGSVIVEVEHVDYSLVEHMAQQMRDRIEELEAKLVEALAVAKIWQEDFIQENNRWGDALRKLEKAVEIGNKMAKSIRGNYYIPNVVAEWNAVLAELEGEE